MSDHDAIRSTLTAHDREVLARASTADFDGHTGFDSLSPAERLAWLDAAVEFFTQHAPNRAARHPQDLIGIEELQRAR